MRAEGANYWEVSKDEICEQCCVNEKGISNTRLVIQTSFLIK